MPGYELSGRIGELGAGVDGWSVGDRVCVLPFAQCGECAACRSGNQQVCPTAAANGVGLGTGRPGGYAERVVVDTSMLFALPDAVGRPGGCARRAGRRRGASHREGGVARRRAGAVLGAGPIGLLTALVLRARGFEQVVVVSRNAARTEKAAALGLGAIALDDVTAGLRDSLGGVAPAAVFECAGTADAARLAVDLARPLGRVVLVGIALQPLGLAATAIV